MLTSANSGTAVSIDKDLRNVPGWHWNPDKEVEPVYITQEQADLTLHIQWISGDSTDNIYGAYGWGPKKAEKLLLSLDQEDWVAAILEVYEENPRPKHKRIKGVCDMEPDEFALSQAICVRILREGEYVDGEVEIWNPIAKCP
jgi:5'-3' exonuclease